MFRLTIRDLLWLMVVVACLCRWWSERMRVSDLEAKTVKMQAAIEGAGYVLDYAWPHLSRKR